MLLFDANLLSGVFCPAFFNIEVYLEYWNRVEEKLGKIQAGCFHLLHQCCVGCVVVAGKLVLSPLRMALVF